MVDFLLVSERQKKNGLTEIYPRFIIKKSSDLMIRGGDFYAVWLEDRGMWSTDEQDALQLIDHELDAYKDANSARFEGGVRVLHMWDSESGMIEQWHRYCQRHMRDSFHMLDERLIFADAKANKKDYASKCLPYSLVEAPTPGWDTLMSTLYSPEERHKIEWCIGAVVSGESTKLQKFMVLYGAGGTGKSTVLNIIEMLFKGYSATFSAKALGSANSAFALEPFRTNPLVAIDGDGDLSRIEDNTRINALVAHEPLVVNEKFKSTYSSSFKCFLFMATNKPVKITDAKSGIIRRLIDVKPTGNLLKRSDYDHAYFDQVPFELGAIAQHCKKIFEENPRYYDKYTPTEMMATTNDFYNFIAEYYDEIIKTEKQQGYLPLKLAYKWYDTYCTEAKVPYPMHRRAFQEELKNYFDEYKERATLADGTRVRNFYAKFKTEQFEDHEEEEDNDIPTARNWIELSSGIPSAFDVACADCPAQHASDEGTPLKPWDKVRSKLKSIDTSKLHYVRVPENHIVIDFDIPDENGEKSLERNLEAANKWPPTYAELSKSGKGVHLHYIYSGDVTKLSRVYDDHIEVKVFTGKSSLRRKLSLCTALAIATISSGLPLKGEDKMVSSDIVLTEKGLRTFIKRNLNKEYHAYTKPSIDFIFKKLEDMYASGAPYDVSDMRNAILAFAANSTHQSEYCIKLINKMKFKSEEPGEPVDISEDLLAFYDVEVFPNLFLVNWKYEGKDFVVRMINPTPVEIERLCERKLVGFNCRRYDNHILYARMMGYSNEQLYKLSQRIISGDRSAFFGEAYNISYTDVYDFSSKKQSLKKFEIELGIHHQELGLPWDEPVPEEMWNKVAEYCDNDVIATEAVFNARKADFLAREILADVAGMTVNDTTNSLTTRIIFGNNRKPQGQFNYRDMGDVSQAVTALQKLSPYDEFTQFDRNNRPIFPGYLYEAGKSTYRGEEVGEGGYVYSEPGMYTNVALLDIASMHPSSIVAEELFGPVYTQRFNDILQARIAIKHKDFEKAKTMLDGKLAKYLDDESKAKDLAQALKIAINSVYGLTSASFDNPFHDIRNKDNIVAKRGALFMINLKHEVQRMGYTVAHIKTDSIKIPNATPEIIRFVMDYGKLYGYNFEHEATYQKMCLVNDAVYIAKYDSGEWTATGTQFQIPYVFKTLFSHEPIKLEDMCETKSVSTALYLDFNESLPEGEHNYRFVGKVGLFCPILPGCDGGELLRQTATGYSSATGAKGYRWKEAEVVRTLELEDQIDRSYYKRLVDEAVHDISQYGDFEWFAS